MNATEATLALEIPDAPPTTPTLFIVLAQYCGPGPANGNWRVFSQASLTVEAAEGWAERSLNKWWIRRKIYKLG